MNGFARFVPAVVVLLALAWLSSRAVPPKDAEDGFRIREFGTLPVVYQGRVKPFDTLARNNLVVISDRQTWRDADNQRRPAIEWLLDVMSGSPRAGDQQVFRIHNEQLQTQLGLERRKRFRYAMNEFREKLSELERQAFRASQLERSERDVYDTQVLELWHKTVVYRVLREAHDVGDALDGSRRGIEAAARRLQLVERFSLPFAIPPGGDGTGEWRPMLRAAVDGVIAGSQDPAVVRLDAMLDAWRDGDSAAFNAALDDYQAHLAANPLTDPPPLRFETLFNHFAPFYSCALLYAVAFIMGCFGWMGLASVFRRSAFWLLAATFLAHTIAIGARIYISGYPPITNLYGTAVFIGWGCVLIGLFLERIYPLGIGNVISSIAGFLSLVIAHFLAGDGDTLEMMQAVLDTKFWLATHVVVINFGYSATFLAGGLASLYLLRGVLTRSLDADTDRVFGRMIYGVLCFALLLSFVGTVLGGLWADDSWGRFWGWDPKENGALMIVLWNALILHARWGGVIRTRGVAVLSVFGSVVTAWSWFGVNQLGVGLHSYGFTDSITFWLLVFVASQLLIIAIGLIPRRLWRSSE